METLIFEGYFCLGRQEYESFGRISYLCKKPPVKHRYDQDLNLYKEILVPPVPIELGDLIDAEDIFDQLVLGKRYRIIIEEIERGSDK